MSGEKDTVDVLSWFNLNEPEWVGRKFRLVRIVVLAGVFWLSMGFYEGAPIFIQLPAAFLLSLVAGGVLTLAVGKVR